nr:MAG TPA: hypothetical protein [Caudoviricetes sp.]
MAKVLNTHEQADFERLAAFYPYRDEHGLPCFLTCCAPSVTQSTHKESMKPLNAHAARLLCSKREANSTLVIKMMMRKNNYKVGYAFSIMRDEM